MEVAFKGQLGAKQVKQGCLIFVASADSHVTMSSGSLTDQRIDELAASFN